MGGLAGGLFAFFESIGGAFYTFLIGSQRARRPQLRTHRVVVGGFIFGLALSCVVGVLTNWSAPRLLDTVYSQSNGYLVSCQQPPLDEFCGRHFQCGMDSLMVIVMNLQIYRHSQLTQGLVAVRVPKVNLELRIKCFLEPILPRRSFVAHG